MKTLFVYFSENSLRGYCHPKYHRIKRKRDKIARAIGELKQKTWYSPVRAILLAIVTVAALAIAIDLVITLGKP